MLRRIAPLVTTGVLLIMAAYSSVTLLTDQQFAPSAGYDFAIYRDAAARWLHGGFYYYPEQVAGPYYTLSGHVMYPPPTLLLFLPFTSSRRSSGGRSRSGSSRGGCGRCGPRHGAGQGSRPVSLGP